MKQQHPFSIIASLGTFPYKSIHGLATGALAGRERVAGGSVRE